MLFWKIFWSIFLFLSIGSFVVLLVVVGIGGFFNIRSLLKGLTKQCEQSVEDSDKKAI